MLLLMKQYGRTIVFGVIAAMVFGAAFGISSDGKKGFLKIAYGKAMEGVSGQNVQTGADAGVNLAIAARKAPKIMYVYEKTVPGKAVNLNKMFSGTDADGNAVDVEITDILNESGESILYQTKADRKENRKTYDTAAFFFPRIGAYTICVKAVDAEQKVCCGRYKIPVTSN